MAKKKDNGKAKNPKAAESAQGATGPAMGQNRAVGSPAEHLVAYQHQPGSNGDVHRGPDKFLRRNAIRVMFLGALADAGLSLEDLRETRKHRKGATLVPMAMVDHCKKAFKNIAELAAAGYPDAFGPFLRMMADAH